jgi:hypothetical protein
MNYLNFYQREIVQITGCQPEQAQEIEDYMINMIFGYNLGVVKCSEFSKGAKEAYRNIKLSLSHTQSN